MYPVQVIVIYLQLHKIRVHARSHPSSYPHLRGGRFEGLPNIHVIWHHHSEAETPSCQCSKALLVRQLPSHRLLDSCSSQHLGGKPKVPTLHSAKEHLFNWFVKLMCHHARPWTFELQEFNMSRQPCFSRETRYRLVVGAAGLPVPPLCRAVVSGSCKAWNRTTSLSSHLSHCLLL